MRDTDSVNTKPNSKALVLTVSLLATVLSWTTQLGAVTAQELGFDVAPSIHATGHVRVDDAATTLLDELVAEAVREYPAIRAERSAVDALRARERQVDRPFDPILTVGMLNVPFSSFRFDQHAMTGVQVGLNQRFYWPGALASRSDEAIARMHAREAAIPETAIGIWAAAVEPYYSLVALDRELPVLNERRNVLRSLLDAAQARYEARAVPLSDVLRVQTQLSRVDQDIATARRNRRIALARLNGLLDRSAAMPVTPVLHQNPIPLEDDSEEWLNAAIANRPAFESVRARQTLIEAQQRAADAEGDPVWTVGFAYTARFQTNPVGDDLFSLMLGINLPFFSNQRANARIDELSAESMRVDYERDEIVRQLRAQIDMHIEALASLEEEIATLDDDLIPSVEGTYESALAHYASSHASVETLIEIQDRLLELDLARTRLVSLHDAHRAQLRVVAADSELIRTTAWERN